MDALILTLFLCFFSPSRRKPIWMYLRTTCCSGLEDDTFKQREEEGKKSNIISCSGESCCHTVHTWPWCQSLWIFLFAEKRLMLMQMDNYSTKLLDIPDRHKHTHTQSQSQSQFHSISIVVVVCFLSFNQLHTHTYTHPSNFPQILDNPFPIQSFSSFFFSHSNTRHSRLQQSQLTHHSFFQAI